jgi:hypothetical protein
VSDVYALVRSIRANELPRNRHFDTHATAEGAEARRVHRFLRAIERDVETANVVRVRRHDNGYTVVMEFSAVRLRRVVMLTAQEYALLVENERLQERLRLED